MNAPIAADPAIPSSFGPAFQPPGAPSTESTNEVRTDHAVSSDGAVPAIADANMTPSSRLYLPSASAPATLTGGGPAPCPHARAALDRRAQETGAAIRDMITQKNFPCIAALKSFHAADYQVGFYDRLGEGKSWRELRQDLLYFLQEQKRSSSIYLTFWAVFKPQALPAHPQEHAQGYPRESAENLFELAMWEELSYLTSEEARAKDWADPKTADPTRPEFRFSLGGAEFFVVGVHPQSSRRGRQFPYPALIFNVFAQFDELQRRGQYDAMVAQNRARDLRFQGSVNPMVAAHGENWEAIQFSGQANGADWKCPFRFLKEADKT